MRYEIKKILSCKILMISMIVAFIFSMVISYNAYANEKIDLREFSAYIGDFSERKYDVIEQKVMELQNKYEETQNVDVMDEMFVYLTLDKDALNCHNVVEYRDSVVSDSEIKIKAIETGSKESYKDSISLLHIYIKDNQLAKAHEWIETITKHNDIAYYFNQAYYLLYKAEGKYKEALHYKEICSDMLDSLTLVQNETKVLEIEKKYNNAKIREENELLKITQQRNTIIIIIAISLFLLSVAGYIIYRQRSKAKIYYQQTILDKMKIELLHLSAELEEKKQVLQKALADKENNAHKLQQEIEVISYKYDRLQKQNLETSTVGKKLISLTKKIGLRTPNSLLTKHGIP